MGKKVTGRKAFLKGARPQELEAQEESPTSILSAAIPLKAEVTDGAEDPSERFLKESCPNISADTVKSPSIPADKGSTPPSSLPEPEESKNLEEESRGQLIQRHKRVIWTA